MIVDKELELATEQAVTVSAGSENYINQGAAQAIGPTEGLQLAITVDEDAAAVGAAEVEFQLQCDSDSAFGTPKTVLKSKSFGKAELTAGREIIYLPLPAGLDEKYIRAYFSVSTGPLTAGKFSCAIVKGMQANKHYPNQI